jgi:hypothetical protein
MFLLLFSALAVSAMTLSSTNLQLASNHHDVGTGSASWLINRAHQVVNRRAARKNINERITSGQEKDHGKETK